MHCNLKAVRRRVSRSAISLRGSFLPCDYALSCCRNMSVSLSVKRVHCDKKIHSFSLLTGRMVGEGRNLVPGILGQTDPVAVVQKRRF